MKSIYPKNIKKGILAGMTFSIGPLNIGVIQLFILAVGVAISLVLFNAIAKSGSTLGGALVAIPVFCIFLIVAFFKISELNLLAFLSKLIRNNFFDTTKKSQVNFEKLDKIEVLIKENKDLMKEADVIIKHKEKEIDSKILESIDRQGF